jgi:hypothetical protein
MKPKNFAAKKRQGLFLGDFGTLVSQSRKLLSSQILGFSEVFGVAPCKPVHWKAPKLASKRKMADGVPINVRRCGSPANFNARNLYDSIASFSHGGARCNS